MTTALGLLLLVALAAGLLGRVQGDQPHGTDAAGVWIALAGWVVLLWFVLGRLAQLQGRMLSLLAPAAFGLAMLYLWEILVVGWEVPRVLLPAPRAVGEALSARWNVLWPDFKQTAISVLAGYCTGCGAGFGVALLADRYRLIQRGLLPLAGLAGAVPIVGIAPIMVMWFGFDWESKAAVAAIVTFFPMLVNTLAGLSSVDAMHRDLMRTYGAGHAATLLKLRLPSALPFVFNALKINSTLALISAIVAEFFGSPIYGLGFRISAEVARMNVDVVWAAIALAALAGSLFYGLIALVERVMTFWHASYRA
ncbi:MAG TPA: ABC transporter permease [Burkholderiaceae bacterium]|nr:ABC transporter permease [Burkholderiaceae bacterium]HSB98579.1 ABC transporter permease [Burkholderiaceae bacterium]